MFNSRYKKEALKECEEAGNKYKGEYEDAIKKSTELHEDKESGVEILKKVDEYIHSLSNRPKEIEKMASEILVRRKAFEKEIEDLKIEAKKADKAGKNIAGGGVLAGAGVAAFGPTAAMGVATTFGTASTGTAIATLSGAAQTNAALAWLGGGAAAAGGGGMAAGETFLAMAGPVGWAIGGAALVGGGLLINSKNKKIAEKAEEKCMEIKKETNKLKEIKEKIKAEIRAIVSLNEGVDRVLKGLKSNNKTNYNLFTMQEKESLRQLMNTAEALSKRIGVKIA